VDFTWLDQSALALWVRETQWGYPIVLTAHVIGMAAVVGTVLMFALRVLGFASRVPIAGLDRLLSVAWCGFALNALSGIALFVAEPAKFLASGAFQTKIALIFAGAISIWLVTRSIADGERAMSAGATVRAKLTAALSIGCWLGAIVAGRLIAYTTSVMGP
jgi:hypothetical protein